MVARLVCPLRLEKAVSDLALSTGLRFGPEPLLGTFAFYVKGRRASPPFEKMTQQSETQTGNYRRTSPTKVQRSQTSGSSNPVRLPTIQSKQRDKEDQTKFHVLLVEDNLVNRRDLPSVFDPTRTDRLLERVLSKQLQKAGCTVHVANHGREALDFLQHSVLWRDNPSGKPVDVILMDLEMPVMDGLTCARRIRELQGQDTLIRHVPLIAVTANARMEQIEISMAAGMVS